MGIKLIPGKRIPAFFVVVYQYGFRKTKGTGTPVLCSAGEFLDGYPPELFLKYIVFYGITIGIRKRASPFIMFALKDWDAPSQVAVMSRMTWSSM